MFATSSVSEYLEFLIDSINSGVVKKLNSHRLIR